MLFRSIGPFFFFTSECSDSEIEKLSIVQNIYEVVFVLRFTNHGTDLDLGNFLIPSRSGDGEMGSGRDRDS